MLGLVFNEENMSVFDNGLRQGDFPSQNHTIRCGSGKRTIWIYTILMFPQLSIAMYPFHPFPMNCVTKSFFFDVSRPQHLCLVWPQLLGGSHTKYISGGNPTNKVSSVVLNMNLGAHNNQDKSWKNQGGPDPVAHQRKGGIQELSWRWA